MKKIIEVEIGFPKSIVQYEGEPTSKLVSTEQLQEELNLQLQQERMYSEEEVLELLKEFRHVSLDIYAVDWFEQIKHK